MLVYRIKHPKTETWFLELNSHATFMLIVEIRWSYGQVTGHLLFQQKTHFVVFFAFGIERRRWILLKSFLFHGLHILVEKINDPRRCILVLIPFSCLWFCLISLEHQEICHDCREDGSWLFLVAVMSRNPNKITGHAGAQIICNKGTLTQTLFFLLPLFCGHFLGVTLTVKCC